MTRLPPSPESFAIALAGPCRVADAIPSRPPHLAAADRHLAQYGWPMARAYRVYSAGDSGSGREEILFVAHDRRPLTGRFRSTLAAGKRVEWLEIEAGW